MFRRFFQPVPSTCGKQPGTGQAIDLAFPEDRFLDEVRRYCSMHGRLSDQQLTELARTLRQTSPPVEDSILALSLGVEAVRRSLDIQLHDCQLFAAWSLMKGTIVQLATGEGKTLVAALAAIGHAFQDRTTHIMTVNDYLAARDFRQLLGAFDLLALEAGLILPGMTILQKRHAYQANIVYGPGFEFGFDYLRDQLVLIDRGAPRLGERVRSRWLEAAKGQHPSKHLARSVAIVDEADSVMLDEAMTPMILSGGTHESCEPDLYFAAQAIAQKMVPGRDFLLDSSQRAVVWTATGLARCIVPHGSLPQRCQRAWADYVLQALQAQYVLQLNVDYVVRQGRLQLVDRETGRILEDRSWSAGLHQAVEAKEGITITSENRVKAVITRQRFLKLYTHLSGLTGTAEGCQVEFQDIYGLPTIEVPSHLPCQLRWLEPEMHRDRLSQSRSIVRDIQACRANGQPVLVGTTSIESTQRLGKILIENGVEHQALTGCQDAEEAAIVAGAGQVGCVTIATNIAGRGTDIRLGPGAAQRGGLHVIATEMQPTLRVERQLMGRAARQGDPGSFRLVLSVEDPLLVEAAPHLAARWRRCLERQAKLQDDWLSAIRKLQAELEAKRADARKRLFALDDWKRSVAQRLSPSA
jgi:preprotein translocase subunit SecA